jgi:chromosome segregation ATPase
MIEAFEELLQKLRDRYDDATGIARKNAESVIRLEKRIAEQEAQLADAHALNREKIAYHTPYHLIEKDNTKLRQDLAERDNRIKTLEEVIRRKSADDDEAQRRLRNQAESIDVLQEKVKTLQTKLDDAHEYSKEQSAVIRERNATVEDLRKQIEVLQESINEYKNKLNLARNILR